MRVLASVLTVLVMVKTQTHYVPAQVLIPALNATTVQILHNATINRTEPTNHTGWDNPLLNTTGSEGFNHTNSNGDLFVGFIHNTDHRLFRQIYWETGRWWTIRERTIKYPHDLPGSYGRHETISAIRAFNIFKDGLNSKAEILAGGVNSRYVTMRLSSTWGHGFKYKVVIYGH